MSRLLLITILSCVLSGTKQAQAQSVTWPQLSRLSTSSIYQNKPVGRMSPALLASEFRDTLPRQIRPTHWKEGGLVGALVVGAFGAWFGNEICRNDEVAGDCTGLILGGVVGGGGVGFLIGALIGGQFPKHAAEGSAGTP